ncbi:hypothetical protein LD119_00706 [Mesoplasma sp. JKS002660]|uniref:hypothetical protein n=1 Tax=Mesoplasma whartonense TaxID=2878854 RepID=UPI0020229DD8|nr:hypothetical protein [Mesoplasma sp. JKS002660]MCL8213755.1 hypothetical protein [Mesoplasma sp. JKS002660]
MIEQEVINNYEVNTVFLAGEVYKLPQEIMVQSSGIEGILRRVQIKYDNSCWVFLVFNDIELWSQAKNLKIGQYIKVKGALSTIYSVKYRDSFTRINVTEIISVTPGKNVWIQPDTIKKRKKASKKKAKFNDSYDAWEYTTQKLRSKEMIDKMNKIEERIKKRLI